MNNTPTLLPVGPAARRLRVPAKWLREEAEAGRIPHLKAGKSLLFDLPIVQRLLIDRARKITKGVVHGQ